MDVVVVNCNTSIAMTEAIATAARDSASIGTTIHALTPTWGVASAEGFLDSFISAAAVLDTLSGWQRPVDAVILAGFGEHGREGARQLLDVPVVDITEAAALTAALIGYTYGVVTTTASNVGPIRQSLTGLGLGDRCSGIRPTGMRVLDLHNDLENTAALFASAAEELCDEGAEVIVLGCAGLAGLQAKVQARVSVPVVDGVAAAVSLCEGLVRQGLRTSKVGNYAMADPLKSRPGWPVSTPRLVELPRPHEPKPERL